MKLVVKIIHDKKVITKKIFNPFNQSHMPTFKTILESEILQWRKI